MTASGPALAFSRAQAAFSAALRAELTAARLRGAIDPGMGPVLFALHERGMLSMSALAEAASVPRSTMTGIAGRLRKRGLVRMAEDPRDRRGIVVALSPKGRAALPRLRRIAKRLDRTFREALSRRDLSAFTRSLERLATTLARV